ncbi:hypothetical protein ES703_71149 [subsurface metagenome]
MSTGKTPKWESELWSYISQSDGQHCPAYSHCQVRLKGEWCADDNRDVLENLYRDNDFRPEKYSTIEDITHSAASEIAKRIELLAGRYLKQGNCHCPPVPTELISLTDEQHPVEVRLLPLKSYHGAIWHLGEMWVIQLNSNDAPAVMRFSLFHEVFHILAHRSATPVFRKRESTATGAFNELVADYFASCVLMPRRWVMEKWADVQDLDKMAEIFVVPKGAMWFTLKLLGLLK